ncbi:MAG: ABC transporter permease [Deltaproteobacteria bacterium]|jgi:putative ABC transport system permease protein|nr:ABC transporter permease [Deltaproteobacteria bacterium]
MRRFNYLLRLARKSAWNRRGTLVLIVFSIALSTALLLGIEKLRTQIRENFVQAVSGTDLIVGARGGDIQLMLYAIFHLGGAANNMGWDSACEIAQRDEVAWSIPISLGDSHRGYPVVATTSDFFDHYRFRSGQRIKAAEGRRPEALFDVAVGAEAAKKLGYSLGRSITLSHGNSSSHMAEHGDMPFTVTGILAPTGTPVDSSLYIGLEGMEAIHINWRGGAPLPGMRVTPEHAARFNLEPKSITAMLLGLKKRSQVFALQRDINAWKSEALTGVMPGVAMDQIWNMVNTGEQALLFVSALVTITGLAGLAAAILAGLGERRRELAVLRSTGARPLDIMILMLCEGFLLVITGIVSGLVALFLLIAALAPVLADNYGIFLYLSLPSAGEWRLMGCICLAGLAAGLIPAFRAYRMSLSDGLTVSL